MDEATGRTEVGTTADADSAVATGGSRTVVGKPKKHGSFLRELPFLLAIAFLLALLIKAFLVQAFYIPSGSMENTLQIRDRVLVNKLVYRFRDIHRGEIVVFNGLDTFTPEVQVPEPSNIFDAARRKLTSMLGLGTPGEKDFIKRVIGVPGDTVACCDAEGRVTINGVGVDEPYLFENTPPEQFGPVTVPRGRLFVMGDHRNSSQDSRAHIGDAHSGTVPIDKVIGRAFVVIWPPDNVKGLRVPHQLERTKDPEALPAAPWSVAVTPPALGLAGAVPLTLARRRLRARRRSASS